MGVEIIKNAIPRSLCLAAEAAWPDPSWPYWHRYSGATANKFGSMDRSRIPPACLAALDALAMAVIPHIGDSFIDYDLHAAGMHMMPPGGFLGRHLDAECHPIRGWRRTHSIVMSVNNEWDAERWGGQLRIESNLDSEPDVYIAPECGTAIVFDTPGQWHQVLQVTECESTCCNPYRKTLALFAWDHGNCSGSTSANFGK